MSIMSCRSCGISPYRAKVASAKPKNDPAPNKPNPTRPKIENTNRKVSVPTRSPARTFNTVGD